jgi:hypothetical protein
MEEGAYSKHFIETVTDYASSSFSHPLGEIIYHTVWEIRKGTIN